MEAKNIYFEKQKFNQIWIKNIIYFVLLFSLIISLVVFFTEEQNLFAFLPFFVAFIIFILFQKLQLLLIIDPSKICYKFLPFHREERIIRKSDINKITVENYNPIDEYGGWGIRFGKKGKAYTTNGNYGIRISFNQNKEILIGTNQPAEVLSYLKNNNYSPDMNL